MVAVSQVETDRLSTFRTRHEFIHFGEFRSLEEFTNYCSWARGRNIPIYILGNGSNTLFIRRRIRTLVLRNCLEPWIRTLGEGRIEVSSSLPVIAILKYCEKNSLDCFYYLASVPAQVGGAVAMNAGGGTRTIFDFIESVQFMDGQQLRMLPASSIDHKHRWTQFAGVHDRLIVSVVFRFPPRSMEDSEIRKRILWCHAHQDLSAPNCGSVFREYYPPILNRVRGLPPWGIAYPFVRAQFSRKVNNWIICRNSRVWPVMLLIRCVQFLHRILGKRALLELIEVE